MPSVWVSGHARDRVAEHHDVPTAWSVCELIDEATEIEPDLARAILQRRTPRDQSRDRFLLAADRRGMFVLAPSWIEGSAFAYTLVTYLRVSPSQADAVGRLFPPVDLPRPRIT
jgi:hypothetical protein